MVYFLDSSPESPVSLLSVPELLVVELGVRPEDLTQSQAARPLPQLPENYLLHTWQMKYFTTNLLTCPEVA